MSDPTTRDLRLRVAEHVMGWRRDGTHWIGPDGDGGYHDDDVPGYESPGALLLIMDRLAELGWRTTIVRDPVPARSEVGVTKEDGGDLYAYYHLEIGPDTPHCLCLAALKAVGAPEGET